MSEPGDVHVVLDKTHNLKHFIGILSFRITDTPIITQMEPYVWNIHPHFWMLIHSPRNWE
jgi:hypothetical protein